jgi:type IV fimbrial biogenesis protein FimT
MKKQGGFNLIEVMIVVALIAILVVVGTPSLQYLIINNRIIAKTNELVGALNYVRSESITRSSSRYKVRPRPIPAGTDWSNGWVVWFDSDGDDEVDEDTTMIDEDTGLPVDVEGETVLKVFDGIQGIVVTQISGSSPVVEYSSRGKLRGSNELQFSICLQDRGANEPKGRIIEVGYSGRVALIDKEFDCMPEEEES